MTTVLAPAIGPVYIRKCLFESWLCWVRPHKDVDLCDSTVFLAISWGIWPTISTVGDIAGHGRDGVFRFLLAYQMTSQLLTGHHDFMSWVTNVRTSRKYIPRSMVSFQQNHASNRSNFVMYTTLMDGSQIFIPIIWRYRRPCSRGIYLQDI